MCLKSEIDRQKGKFKRLAIYWQVNWIGTIQSVNNKKDIDRDCVNEATWNALKTERGT